MIPILRMTLRSAARGLRRNRLRTALTILGMVVGVGAVITVIGIGQGASQAVEDEISAMGTNLLTVVPGTRSRGGAHSGWGGRSNLTVSDATAIERESPLVDAVTYSRSGGAQIVYGNANWATAVYGTTPSFQLVGNSEVASGAYFDDQDLRNAARVVLLGSTIVEQLFEDGEDPIGAVVRIRDAAFRVIGVLAPRGGSTFSGDRDDYVVMPYTTAVRRVLGNWRPGMVQQIMISATPGIAIDAVEDDVEAILRDRHRLSPIDDNDFTVYTQEEASQMASTVMGILSSVLGGVASISLLVGGIGIMNILLVSVTERTREIGIRVAVGAKSRHILVQFLVEAMLLSGIGGAIGVVLGIAGTWGISRVADFPFVFSPAAAVGAVAFSAAVGVFFGFYPARQAARLDPIASLRYE